MKVKLESTFWKDVITIGVVILLSTGALWMVAGMRAVYQNFDGPYYLVVAKSWYNPRIIAENFSFELPLEYYAAHYPLYPALISLSSAITRLPGFQTMLLVNLMATIAAAVSIYYVGLKHKVGSVLFLVLAWLFLWPRMWVVRFVGSPETLFILWTVWSLYFFEEKKYWLAGLFGSLAVLTKSPGILLLVAYGLWFLHQGIKHKKWETKVWPVGLIGLTLLGLFSFFKLQTGDFWAYFNSGDNIHLQSLPFRIFDSTQSWVGSFWLEDVLWIYLIGGVGVYRAFKKSPVWGWFGAVFFTTILFVSHRDISRYSLPLVPVILLGLSELFDRKEVKWAVGLLIIPAFFYSLNFILNNLVTIGNWAPFY